MGAIRISRLMKNESACARSLQLSRSAKRGATEPRKAQALLATKLGGALTGARQAVARSEPPRVFRRLF